MTDDQNAPQGVPDSEPAAQLDQTAPAPSTEATEIKAEPAEPIAQETDDSQPKREPPLVKRIHQQSAKIADLARQNDEYRRALEAIRGGEQQPEPQGDQTSIRAQAEAMARQIAAQERHSDKVNSLVETGRKDNPRFDEECNLVAAMGATDRPDFMEIIVDTEGGHKVVSELAKNPDEAARILALPTHRMAFELGKLALNLSARTPVAKPLSKAPAPINPIGGVARVTDEVSDDLPIEEWMRRETLREAKRRGLA